MKRLIAYFRRETVFTVSLVLALLSFLVTPPTAETLRAIDGSTLCLLFALMTTVAVVNRAGVFRRLGQALTRRVKGLRGLSLVLILCCFFLSMAATNDVALITLVPFTLLLLSAEPGTLLIVVVLETIAANLGSMVTPIGNPQNLYLYASGRVTAGEVLLYTLPYAAVSLVLLSLAVLALPRKTVSETLTAEEDGVRVPGWLCWALPIASLLGVARVIPVWASAAAVLMLTLLGDRQTLRHVDYTLLGTFLCFFLFVDGIKRWDAVRQLLEGWMAAQPLITPLLCSQIISNVPACLLLSPFAADAKALLLGVDLGGLGTLVASLASLISFKLYSRGDGAQKGRYLLMFTVLNVLGLLILLGLAALLGDLTL